MPKFNFPIRVKVLLTVLVLIMVVMSLNTSTMANLFREDKTAYIRDLTSVMAIHIAEEAETLLRHYAANMRTFGDVIYNGKMDPATKQEVLGNLFRNYEDIVAIAAQSGDSEPVTVFDTSALTALDVSRATFLDYQAENPLPRDMIETIDVRLERITEAVTLVRLTIRVPATDSKNSFVLAASIDPAKLMAVTNRSRGFEAAIRDPDGQPLFHQGSASESGAPGWPAGGGEQPPPSPSFRSSLPSSSPCAFMQPLSAGGGETGPAYQEVQIWEIG